MLKMKLKNQKGFTLIEIIAVLVILGILAAVAVPRFMNLTEEASKKAAMQAVAEGKSRLSNQFAKFLLERSGAIPSTASLVAVAATDAGDYSLSFSASGSNVIITARLKSNPAQIFNTGTWIKPQ